jgi:hypothetical protein
MTQIGKIQWQSKEVPCEKNANDRLCSTSGTDNRIVRSLRLGSWTEKITRLYISALQQEQQEREIMAKISIFPQAGYRIT